MLKKPLFTRKNQDCTAKNQIGNIVFNYRFTGNSRLKKLIESNNLVFRLHKHRFPGSSIQSDYILSDNTVMFFIDEGEPVTIFTAREDQLNNLNRCLKLKTLKISKENIDGGACETIFVSPSYRQFST